MFRIIPEGAGFSEYALLRDGESVLLRTATREDVPAVEALLSRVSRESLQMRFMGAVAQVPRAVLEILCSGDGRDRLCLLAVVGQDGQDDGPRVVGMGNYISLGIAGKAEVAFLVDDAWQGRGISTLLLERLAGIAAAHGFVGFEAEVLYDNQAMINVLRDSGFESAQAVEGGSIHVALPVTGAASLRERVELRDRIAVAHSLLPLLSPRTVAVAGASRDPEALGSLIFRAILRSGFGGTVFPVNPKAASVNGVKAYASVRELPEPAELVVVAVPAEGVLPVVRQALQAGSKGFLVVTSGFAESGAEGAARQRELVELVRSHGARLIGPNCLGLLNTRPEVSLNASLAQELPPPGRIGFYSHSAALGLVILATASERGLGFSTFVSAGNRADVSGNDLLQFWEEDPQTDLALLYLETFGNPRRFARIARRVSYRKPILCVKSARSRAGRDVARAHIAAVPQGEAEIDVLFRQAGVLRADTLEEMFDAALLLAHQPLPRGGRVAVLSNSGGILTICADACEANGLSLSGPGATDLGSFADVEAYERGVEAAVAHPDVDALIAIFACVGRCDPQLVGRAIRRGVLRAERASGVAKPVLLCLMGASGAVELDVAREGRASRHVFPSYRFPESAARALAQAVRYAAFRAQPAGRLVFFDGVDAAAARLEVQELLEAGPEAVSVGGAGAARLLGHFGIETETDAEGEAETLARLDVRPDPSFGPLVVLRGQGGASLRITPLTDRDARELVGAVGLPADAGVEELLGRVSQLVEELPWLSELEAAVVRAGSGAALAAAARLVFRRS